jgi:chromosome segregation ATPase
MRDMYHIPSLEYFTIVKLEDALKKQLEATRRLQQELQQLQDETCLEVDEMQEIIDNQQEHIKQMTAQLHNTLERKLQMSFELSAAQQEIAALNHSHSDACEMNRRLCLDLEKADQKTEYIDHCRQEVAAARAQADNATQDAINCRNTNDSLLEKLQRAEADNKFYAQRFGTIFDLEVLKAKVQAQLFHGKAVDYRELILTGVNVYKPQG